MRDRLIALITVSVLASQGCAHHEKLREAFESGAGEPMDNDSVRAHALRTFPIGTDLRTIWASLPASDLLKPQFTIWPNPPKWRKSQMAGAGVLVESLDDCGLAGRKGRYLIIQLEGDDSQLRDVRVERRYGMPSSPWGSTVAN